MASSRNRTIRRATDYQPKVGIDHRLHTRVIAGLRRPLIFFRGVLVMLVEM